MSELEQLERKMEQLGIVAIEDADSLPAIKDAIAAVEELDKDPKMIAALLHLDALNKRTLNTPLKLDKFFERKHIGDISLRRKILKDAMEATSLHYCPENMVEEMKYEWDKQMYCAYEWTNHLTLK